MGNTVDFHANSLIDNSSLNRKTADLFSDNIRIRRRFERIEDLLLGCKGITVKRLFDTRSQFLPFSVFPMSSASHTATTDPSPTF